MIYVKDLYIPGILSCRKMHSHAQFMARVSFRSTNPLAIRFKFMDTFQIEVARDLLWQAVTSGTENDCAVIGQGDVTLKVLRSDNATLCLSFLHRVTDEERAEHNNAMMSRYSDDPNEGFARLLGTNEHPRGWTLWRRADLYRWLKRTYDVVPYGREVRECDIDDAIAKILEGSK